MKVWMISIAFVCAALCVLVYGYGWMASRRAATAIYVPHGCKDALLLSAMRERPQPEADLSEAGGIWLAPSNPQDEDGSVTYTALASVCTGSERVDREAVAAMLASVASRFIAQGELDPGRYDLDTGAIRAGSGASDTVVTVDVSPQHLQLLRSMNTRAYGHTVALMDSKRPYGDMSHFYIDMASALGEPVSLDSRGYAVFSPEVIERYRLLHIQMLRVAQVFWRNATLPNLH